MFRLRTFLLVLVLLVPVFGLGDEASTQEIPAGTERPNFVYILLDDADASQLRYMPNTQRYLGAQGTTFENAIMPTPICCPARASTLRGQYAHNTGIRDNYRGTDRFRKMGHEQSTVATWLNGSGYHTALFGKYLNDNFTAYKPPGWEYWAAQVGNSSGRNGLVYGDQIMSMRGKHTDSVISQRALGYADAAAKSDRPFFQWVSFNAPHSPGHHDPAYANTFRKTPLPRPPSFNEADVSDKPAYVRNSPRLGGRQVTAATELYRDQLRGLQTVDAFVGELVGRLASNGELDNTYIVLFTDNGLRHGEHRLWPPGKGTPYEEDVNFPMLIRGPGVPAGQARQELVSDIDIGPTFADLAGTATDGFVDGRSFAPLLAARPGEEVRWRDAVLLESVPLGIPDGVDIPGYSGVRTEDTTYVEYSTGEKELYDLEADPYQLQNLTGQRPAEEAALGARLEALRDCAARSCRAAEGP